MKTYRNLTQTHFSFQQQNTTSLKPINFQKKKATTKNTIANQQKHPSNHPKHPRSNTKHPCAAIQLRHQFSLFRCTFPIYFLYFFLVRLDAMLLVKLLSGLRVLTCHLNIKYIQHAPTNYSFSHSLKSFNHFEL